ncbi:HAD-IA family hydrolase [Secundilactobacillus kimchicus]|uniref:HAD-IA family hydrolase n=1 Tax=Secundilactobacillus kimchicus TaxID=528209 RepID=UPI0024366BB8|nr:HAD-IA family hydrolase [Secundilactobacillus kimchicus]
MGRPNNSQKKALQLDLHRWFKRANLIISDEVGLAKPDARIFTYFNRKLNLQANEVVYIGDDYNTDMIGAKQLDGTLFGLITAILIRLPQIIFRTKQSSQLLNLLTFSKH